MRHIPCLFALSFTILADRPDPAAVARGQKEFISSCGFCHGNDARGNRAPDLVRSPLVNRDDHGELIGPIIRNGRPEKGMPGLPLSQQQISDITAFLKQALLNALNSNSVARDYPVEKLLTGNAKAGEAYFKSKCSQCHSPTGDLAGVAKKHSPIDLQSLFLSPRGARSTATVTLPDGKTLHGTLEFLDDFDVAIRESDGTYHSWPREGLKVDVKDPLAAHRELLKQYSDADVHNIFAYLETLK